MAKVATLFICRECGAEHRKWAGQCSECGAWNAVEEDAGLAPAGPSARSLGRARGRAVTLGRLAGGEASPPRGLSGISELDRVLGGGLVPGSAILVGGDPGIGKSTLLLQALAAFAGRGANVVYVTGEEAPAQIRLRAERLGLADAPVRMAAETNLRDILTTLEAERPDLVVIDSIQTMWVDNVDSAPGSVAQVRASAYELTVFAKRQNIAVVLVGHVTKEGQIAGPRVVEHMVDTVLYFEGERSHRFRILRTVKNRFGPADEIGVFEMTGRGLAEVANPSALFLGERGEDVPGSAVFAGIEGTRPVLVEFQALVAPSALGTPRRAVVGWDASRLSMVLAVLDARCGVGFAGHDIYLNVAGGLRVTEPAADLAAAAALVSALSGTAVPADTVHFGEVSLSGGVRPVPQPEARLREAAKLGFSRAVVPAQVQRRPESDSGADNGSGITSGMSLREITALGDLASELAGR